MFGAGDHRYRQAFTTSPAGAADPVHVILGHFRNFVIDHVRQLFDIQPACSDVGGDQRPNAAGLEVGQRLGARTLALVAVDGGGRETVGSKLFRQPVGAVLGAGEDEHLAPVVVTDHP